MHILDYQIHVTDGITIAIIFSNGNSFFPEILKTVEKFVKTLERWNAGKLLIRIKIKIEEKIRKNVENKQTFGFTRKNELFKLPNEKTRQNAENKQTCDLMVKTACNNGLKNKRYLQSFKKWRNQEK